MHRICFLIVLFVFSGLNTNAFSRSGFEESFLLVRNDQGELSSIKMKNSSSSLFSVKKYMTFLKAHLSVEKERLQERGFLSIRKVEIEEISKNKILKDGLEELKNFPVEKLFSNPKIDKFITDFETRLNDNLALLDLSILAKPNDPDFFLKKKRAYQSVTWALTLAKKVFSDTQVLNFVTQIIHLSEKNIREKREFEQYKLMHYLENFDAHELGLSHDEANHVMSSLFESKRPWYNFWDKDSLSSQWDEYGFKSFFTLFRNGTKKLKSSKIIYDGLLTRYNFAFQEVMLDGKKVILNLQDSTHLFDSSPALAYDFENPDKIAKKRLLLELLCLGVGQISVLPDWVRSLTSQFLHSFYKKQVITEGALAAYFFEMGDHELYQAVVGQSLNPYLSF